MDRHGGKDWTRLGAWLARERRRQGFETQEALAEAAGMSRQTVLRLEGGKQIADGSLRRLEDALGLQGGEMDDVLFGFDPDPKPRVPAGPVDWTDSGQALAALQVAATLGELAFTGALEQALQARRGGRPA